MEKFVNEDKRGTIPRGEKVAWSVGTSADIMMGGFVGQVLMPIYNIVFGVDSKLVGLAVTVPRLLDAFTDPIVGNISDNTRSRWGRRKPYMLIGGLLSALFFMAMWMPPIALGPTGKFWYLLILLSIYFPVAFAMFSIPQAALGYELTTDPDERTRIMSYRAFFGAVVSMGIPWFYWLAQSSVFANPAHPGLPPETFGVRYLGAAVALICVAFILMPILFCKERARAQSQDHIPLLHALKHTFTNRAFLVIGLVTWAVITARYSVDVLTTYVNIYYVAQGDKEFGTRLVGVAGTVFNFAGLLMIPGIAWIATRYGKKRTLLVGEVMALIAALLVYVLYTPRYPYLQILCLIVTVPGIQCVWILGNSMLADVCDADELKSGLRREGMFGGAFLVMIKLACSAASFLTGACVSLAGYDPAVPPSPQVVQNIRLMFVFIPAGCLLFATILTFFYPLTDRRIVEIKEELALRRK